MTSAVNPTVVLSTSHGDITLELLADKAPITVENFLSYVDDGFFADTLSGNRFMDLGGSSRTRCSTG